MSTPNEENEDLKGKYEFREVPLYNVPEDGPNKATFDLMVMMMGCLLFRLGGQEIFTIAEIDSIRESVGRVRIVLDTQDRLVLTIKPTQE